MKSLPPSQTINQKNVLLKIQSALKQKDLPNQSTPKSTENDLIALSIDQKGLNSFKNAKLYNSKKKETLSPKKMPTATVKTVQAEIPFNQ